MLQQNSGPRGDRVRRVLPASSSALEECVERVKTLEPVIQNLIVSQTLFCPPFEHAIDSQAFDALKFCVVQIGVMNHLRNSRDGFVSEGETFYQCLKCAVIAVMRKFGVQHVERNCAGNALGTRRENKLRLGIDKPGDQPGRTGPVDLRARTSEPRFPAILLRLQCLKFSRTLRSFNAPEQHRHFVSARTIEKIDLSQLAELPG